MLAWTDDHTFSIDGCKFTLDYQHGGSRRLSQPNDFTMMKTPTFLEHYCALAGQGIKKVLELGVYQGGSFVFLDKVLRPDRISAVEISGTAIPALDAYVAENRDRAKVYYSTSQADVEALSRIVAQDFGGEVDLVVDDASHFYEETKVAFVALFPKLKPGGFYIIEDWMWSFEAAFQEPAHPWFEKNSLANILMDLAEDMTLNNAIESVEINRHMLIIKRSSAQNAGAMFAAHGRRGREYQLL